MAESYLGGCTVITIRHSDADMKRRQEHWKQKLARQQREFDAERERERQDKLRRFERFASPHRTEPRR